MAYLFHKIFDTKIVSFRKLAITLLLVHLIFVCYSQNIKPKPNLPLHQYNFVRDNYNPNQIPLLMGNSEMYGLVDKKGGGFDHLWYSDVWSNYSSRIAIKGPLLECIDKNKIHLIKYNQEIKLDEGVARTNVEYQDGTGYQSTVFCSMNDKHLLGIKIKTKQSQQSTQWTLKLLNEKVFINQISNHKIQGRSFWFGYLQAFAFCVKADKPISKNALGLYEFSLAGGDSITILYHFYTIFDNPNFEKAAYEHPASTLDFESLLRLHQQSFKENWNHSASIILPSNDYAKLFYRSIYSLFCMAGDHKFLPGEGIPESSDPYLYWDMKPFTYGAAGWATEAFTRLGNQKIATQMLNAHFKPTALIANGRSMFPVGKKPLYHGQNYLGEYEYLKNYKDEIWLFGHELNMDNTNHFWMWDNSHMDWQVHLNAFAGSLFHSYSKLFPQDTSTLNKTYSVLRGTAQFWSNLATWNDSLKAYSFPPLNSLTENLFQKSPLDAMLAAKWNLIIAAQYARLLQKDNDLSQNWDSLASQLYIPQNEKLYLEYLGDDGTREGGGYQGIRGGVYLSYPTSELISYLDKSKIQTTLDTHWKRNKNGEGMITFLANWFALSDAYLGNGNQALEKSSYCLSQMDYSQSSLYEVKNEPRPYFLDGYASFILVPISMLLQSNNNVIYPFAAVPKNWQDVSFYDLPSYGGVRVSGEIKKGKVKWVQYIVNGKVVFEQKNNNPVIVERLNNNIYIKPK